MFTERASCSAKNGTFDIRDDPLFWTLLQSTLVVCARDDDVSEMKMILLPIMMLITILTASFV